jgi:xanthine dehydrogenase small subunit
MATLRFLLNGAACREDDAPPGTTVLDYLRTARRLTGTKEGCAEGDCGACAIAIKRPRADRYEAVNSCLMLLPQIDGASVLTVEGLARPDGSLHPAQQALMETDGTQCGFCTPGFVMAMAAFLAGSEEPTDAAIHEALAGNLCRCTGYRPIVAACRKAAALPAPPLGDARAEQGLAKLDFDNEYSGRGQRFFAPQKMETLIDLLKWFPDATLLGGGTDLGLLASKERKPPACVISTAGVPELKRIEMTEGWLTLGGAVTYTEILPHLDQAFPALGALVRRIGSRQIRNLGTIAGNIATASPIGDTLPCLIALDARVALRSSKGMREKRVEEFITGYRKTALGKGEFIEAIRIPRLDPGQRFFVYKLSKRFDQDISAVIAAFRLTTAGGALRGLSAVYGGMAAAPKRAGAVEKALTGKPWTQAALADIDAAVARDFQPMDDQRASAAYRLRAAANLVRRLQMESADGPAPARLEEL